MPMECAHYGYYTVPTTVDAPATRCLAGASLEASLGSLAATPKVPQADGAATSLADALAAELPRRRLTFHPSDEAAADMPEEQSKDWTEDLTDILPVQMAPLPGASSFMAWLNDTTE